MTISRDKEPITNTSQNTLTYSRYRTSLTRHLWQKRKTWIRKDIDAATVQTAGGLEPHLPVVFVIPVVKVVELFQPEKKKEEVLPETASSIET